MTLLEVGAILIHVHSCYFVLSLRGNRDELVDLLEELKYESEDLYTADTHDNEDTADGVGPSSTESGLMVDR